MRRMTIDSNSVQKLRVSLAQLQMLTGHNQFGKIKRKAPRAHGPAETGASPSRQDERAIPRWNARRPRGAGRFGVDTEESLVSVLIVP